MPAKNEDDRSSLAQATALGSSVVGAALTLVIPPLAGYWIDRQLGWPGVCIALGVALGVYLAVQRLRQITRSAFGTAQNRGVAASSNDNKADNTFEKRLKK